MICLWLEVWFKPSPRLNNQKRQERRGVPSRFVEGISPHAASERVGCPPAWGLREGVYRHTRKCSFYFLPQPNWTRTPGTDTINLKRKLLARNIHKVPTQSCTYKHSLHFHPFFHLFFWAGCFLFPFPWFIIKMKATYKENIFIRPPYYHI